MRHGMALFLLGLLTGLAEPQFLNPRMALAAHLEGVILAAFLIALGAAWGELALGADARRFAYFAILTGAYGNWAVTALGAMLGTAALNPIVSDGHHASAAAEMLVGAGFTLVGIVTLVAACVLAWGFWRRAAA